MAQVHLGMHLLRTVILQSKDSKSQRLAEVRDAQFPWVVLLLYCSMIKDILFLFGKYDSWNRHQVASPNMHFFQRHPEMEQSWSCPRARYSLLQLTCPLLQYDL